MKPPSHHSGDDWLDNLDAIIAGKTMPEGEDAELFSVATRLAAALAPLREIARAGAPPQPLRRPMLLHKKSQLARRHLSRPWLLVATLLLLICLTTLSSTTGRTALWSGMTQIWQVSTSLNQIKGVSIASLSPPRAGVRPLPLLPRVLPEHTQAASYGVLTDASNPNLMTSFVASYRIGGQDLLLYEQPSRGAFSSTAAQTVQIGSRQGQMFQDEAGEHALQWYQDGMLCQLTSKLPVAELIQLASVFQPIQSWDLLL